MLLSQISSKNIYCLWPCSLAITSTGRVGLWFLWFYVQEHPKAQAAFVLVLKRLRRQGHGLKFNPTDWEKPSSLQCVGLFPTPGDCGFSKNHHVMRYKIESLVLFLLLSVKH